MVSLENLVEICIRLESLLKKPCVLINILDFLAIVSDVGEKTKTKSDYFCHVMTVFFFSV